MKAVLPRRSLRLLLLVLVWLLTPGLSEVTENLWHLVASGHAAHAAEAGPGHAPQDDEHGCNGTFHVCSCHHTLASDLVPALAPRVEEGGRDVALALGALALEPPLPRLDRPPRA